MLAMKDLKALLNFNWLCPVARARLLNLIRRRYETDAIRLQGMGSIRYADLVD